MISLYQEALKVQNFLYETKNDLTLKQYIQVLKGNKLTMKNNKIVLDLENSCIYGYLKHWKVEKIEIFLRQMLIENFLFEKSKSAKFKKKMFGFMTISVTK